MAKNQSSLTPQQQAQLFELLKQSGQQPTSGGQSMTTSDLQAQQGIGNVDAAGLQGLFGQQQAAPITPQPGDKMDPNEAMRQILMGKATGPQLQALKGGGEGIRVPVNQPLFAALGFKKDAPLPYQNYADVAMQEGLVDHLPTGIARDSKGNPIVGKEMLETARRGKAASKKSSPVNLKAVSEFGAAFLERAGTPEQVAQWKALPDDAKAELIKQLPGFRTQRQEFYKDMGTTKDGKSVQQDLTTNKWFIDGKEVDAGEVGRLVPRLRPHLQGSQVDEISRLLDAQTQLNIVKDIFDPSVVGPVENRIFRFSKLTGIDMGFLNGVTAMTDNKVKLQTVMSSAINDYIKAITGAQMSEVEARRIMAALPAPGSAEEAFLPALEQIQQITTAKLNNRLKVLKSQGTVGIEAIEGAANEVNAQSQGKPAPKQTILDAGISDYIRKNKIRDTPANREWARKKLGL